MRYENQGTVMGLDITHKRFEDKDFLSLTDIAKYKTDAPDKVIATWMRVYNTICYLGTWEKINNPNFKPHIYEGFKTESAENNFWLSPKKWTEQTNAMGMFSKAGNNGGTFAHKD